MAELTEIVDHLDALLRTKEIPDYSGAVNGLQVANRGTVKAVAAAVDFSRRTIEGAVAAGADLLLVHHGMFWGGTQPIRGPLYDRLRLLFAHDVAVYASHLPLDAHAEFGNNVLLARELGLEPSGEFARYQTIAIGVRGETDEPAVTLVDRARRFARAHGGEVRTAGPVDGHRTRRWAICTGAGASAETLAEARALSIDMLIVGEGAHWTAVDAADRGLLIIYAGHYATETLGVQALARHISTTFGIPWSFVEAPTSL